MGHLGWHQFNNRVLALVSWLSVFTLGGFPAWGQITSTESTTIIQNGEQLEITGGVQSVDGINLFHQFDLFNVAPGETVTFIAPDSIENILGRVGGGQASIIDGGLAVSNDANLWLINPAGLLFGPNVQLNLQGDFSAATADAIGFNQGWFTEGTDYYTLTGAPSSFAFISSPGYLVNLGDLGVAPGQNLRLLGGSVLNVGSLVAPEGTITVAAVTDDSRVNISQAGQLLTLETDVVIESGFPGINPVDLPTLLTGDGPGHGAESAYADRITVAADGSVSLTQTDWVEGTEIGAIAPGDTAITGTVTSAGDSGGQIAILGDRIALVDAQINADGISQGGQIYIGGNYQGAGPLPNATRTVVNSGTTLSANGIHHGDGGEIIIWADQATAFRGDIQARGGELGGNGGLIEISGKSTLSFDGTFDLSAPQGDFGSILFDPDNIEVVNGIGLANGDVELILPPFGTVVAADGDNGWFTIYETTLELWNGNANILLQANNNIVIRNLGGDNELRFQPGSGSITFTADADNDGVGSFDVEKAGDLINTSGRDITISGRAIDIEFLDAGTGDVSLIAQNLIQVRETLTADEISLQGNGMVLAGGNDSISGNTLSLQTWSPGQNIAVGSNIGSGTLDLSETDIRALKDGFTSISIGRPDGTGTIILYDSVADGGAAAFKDPVTILGGDTLQGPDQLTTWTITGNNQGNLDSIFSNGLTFENIDRIVARNNTSDILQGTGDDDTITLSRVNGGTFNGIDFDGIQNIRGLGGDDSFIFANGVAELFGSIDGGTGNNTLDFSNYITDIVVDLETGSTSGTGGISNIQNIIGGFGNNTIRGTGGDDIIILNGIETGSLNELIFQGFETILPGDGEDRFILNEGVAWTRLDGGAGTDTVDYGSYTTGVTIDLQNNTAKNVTQLANIEDFRGGMGVDTLLGTSGADAIAITGNNSGTLGSITFSGIENLDGQAGNDQIEITNTGTITGNIEGGGGTDTLDYSAYTNDVTFNFKQNNGSAVNSFTGLESFIGGDGNDTFMLNPAGTVNRINSIEGGAGNNTLVGDNVASVWNLTGTNTGNGPGVSNFSSIQNLVAGDQSDQVNFLASDAQFTGILNGRDGGLTLMGDSIGIGTAVRGFNELIFQPISADRDIHLGGLGLTPHLDISTAELLNISNDFTAITIGHSAGTGNITLGADVTLPVPTTIQTPNGNGSIDTQGFHLSAPELTLLAAQDITTADLTAINGITLNSGGAVNTQNILTSQTLDGGNVVINANRIAAQQINAAGLTNNGGDITLTAADSVEVAGSILSTGDVDGGNVVVDANRIAIQEINVAGSTNNGGDITLTAAADVELAGPIQATGNVDGGNVVADANNITTQRINVAGFTNNGGDVTLTAAADVEIAGSIQATGNVDGGNVVVDANNITTQQINATGLTNNGGDITLTAAADVEVAGPIQAGGLTDGGNVAIDANRISTQEINVNGLTNNGGDVTLSSVEDIEVASIRAEGNLAGGSVDIASQEFFRATDNFTALNGLAASISTAAVNGTGSITIRHAGNGSTPFNVGDDNLLGSNAALTSGDFQLTLGSSFLNSHILGNISILTQDIILPVIAPPVATLPSSPVITTPENISLTINPTFPLLNSRIKPLEESAGDQDSRESNSVLFERLESSFSDQFTSHLNLYERVSVSSTSLASAQQTLSNVEASTGVKPGVLYVYFLPPINKDTASPDANGLDPNDELGLLLLTHKGQAIRQKVEGVTRRDVMAVAETFSAQVTNAISSSSQYLPPAQQLYDWFISPVEAVLTQQGIQSLALAMDTGLRTLPVAALHNGDEFLVERYSLGVIPSFSLTDFNSENFLYSGIGNTQVLAMGASQFPSQQALPAVPEELEIVTKAFSKSEVFLNEDFTLNNLQTQIARNEFGVVHLASHGVFESGAPRNSYIQLWDQHLQLDQVHTLGLQGANIALMVLSACNTALGDREAEYGFAGLAVNAGVQTSVASLWPISDEGTLGMMTYFYESLLAEPVRAHALRQAQLAMLRGELQFSEGTLYGLEGRELAHFPELQYHGRWNFAHPFYWSTYTLVGSPW
ncbi:CHAT domain-containing protein [Leptothoe sp. PORK10 BA2]|uniref:CHAT domain-containing protein n=1 Tax=Leptothoe sp. PORK10 BA2 TaxID=3110254 RepID=UPI002B1FA163|nr:CHAT domain-containing protein [Leptothoe sp. PORK10 BA2]MEA5462281.1 CHAT domain-containing protein [Leptothoe sp. PORK10 BA2]